MDLSYWNIDNIINNEETFINDIHKNNLIHKIPLINYVKTEDLIDNQLVRFRGMIQDMYDPEFYMERYEVLTDSGTRVQDGKYRDLVAIKENETVNSESKINVTGERGTLFVISVPGLNQWVIDIEKSYTKSAYVKETIDNNEGASGSVKRTLDNEDDITDPNFCQMKKLSTALNADLMEQSDNGITKEVLLNSPMPTNDSKACMIKIYSNIDSFKLNELIDVIGFLSINPILDGHNDNLTDNNDKKEYLIKNPPPSLIPRLHCVYYKNLTTINPLLDETIYFNNNYNNNDNDENNIDIVLKNIKLILTQLLFDDEITANYLLCHLISKVYIRNDNNTLGQFTLNIYNIPDNIKDDYIILFNDIIKLLLPITINYNMTIDNLNKKLLIPEKDYNLNRINTSLLQLTNNTEIIINETLLSEGKLNIIGINNINYINKIIEQQKLTCDFQYYKIDYNINYNLLILSNNKTLLSSNTVNIPLKYNINTIKLISDTGNAIKYFLTNISIVNNIRKYLTNINNKNDINFIINDEDQEIIQNDFHILLKENNNNNKHIKSDDLHNLLIITRLLCLSNGKNKFDRNLWNIAKMMEIERKARIYNYKI